MQKNRFAIVIDDKWQGGSFATEEEAKAVARSLRAKNKDQRIEVGPKAEMHAWLAEVAKENVAKENKAPPKKPKGDKADDK